MPAKTYASLDLAADAASPSAEVKFHSLETVAAMLGLPATDVRALIRRGELAAREVAGRWFVTATNLGAFMSRRSDGSGCPRFKVGELVVFIDEKRRVYPGVYVGDTASGRPVVERRGFLGDYRQAFHPLQVQPLTVRLPTESA